MTETGLTVRHSEMSVPSTSTIDVLARMAKIYSGSSLVPAHYRNKMEDCFVALQMAYRLGVDPFMLMQKTYVIQGKPAMEGALMIALANASGRYDGPLQYKLSGSGESRECYAFTTIKGKEVRGPSVSVAMAKAEGWTRNAKWQTMTDLMLTYRSAAFFVRTNCPEVTLGLLTAEEARDIIDITPELVQETHPPAPKRDSGETSPGAHGFMPSGNFSAPDIAFQGAGTQNTQSAEAPAAPDDRTGMLFPPELPGDLDAKIAQHDVLKTAYEQFSIAFGALPIERDGLNAIYQKCRKQWGNLAAKDGCLDELNAIKILFWQAAAEAGYEQPNK